MRSLGVTPGIVVYTWVIQSCIKSQQILIALKKFDEMKKHKIQGDAITFETILKGWIHFKKFEQGLGVLEVAISDGIIVQSDIIETIVERVSDNASTDIIDRVSKIRENLKRNWMGKSDKQWYTRKYGK